MSGGPAMARTAPQSLDLLLIMSAFGKADGFVVSAAAAARTFFLALLVVAWNDRRAARSVA